MVIRISRNSERTAAFVSGAGRFEARLADRGWVVFDIRLQQVAIVDGRRLDGLSESQAGAKADELSFPLSC
jgi:hypothetical protein